MSALTITMTVNGQNRALAIEPNETLLNVLRERLGLTGAKYGCGIGECGACTVLLDGKPVLSCQLLAVTCDGKSVVTAEGLSKGKEVHPMQEAYVDEGAVQCGFCTPGMVISSVALVREKPIPSTEDIKEALRGNVCRCTGYENIINAVKTGAEQMKPENRHKKGKKR